MQVSDSEEIGFPLHDLDVVIMNPPFTENKTRGRKFGAQALKRMQRRELDIRDHLQRRDDSAGLVISINSIQTFFAPLAERLLHSDRGVLAKVLPVAACMGGSALAQRRFLAERFHIERIVTTHDPRRIAFSENTGIHECLLICRRHPGKNRPTTEFVSLRRMPSTALEAVEAADALSDGRYAEWGQRCVWPTERVQAGDWTPVQWYDGELAEVLIQLEGHPDFVPAGSVLKTGATQQAAQDSWKRATHEEPSRQVRVFDTVSAKVRHSMLGAPEQPVVPGGRRIHLHDRVLQSKGNLMLATRFNTVSGLLTALWTEDRSPNIRVWMEWPETTASGRLYEQALCAWWNSTPGRLLLLNRRGKSRSLREHSRIRNGQWNT